MLVQAQQQNVRLEMHLEAMDGLGALVQPLTGNASFQNAHLRDRVLDRPFDSRSIGGLRVVEIDAVLADEMLLCARTGCKRNQGESKKKKRDAIRQGRCVSLRWGSHEVAMRMLARKPCYPDSGQSAELARTGAPRNTAPENAYHTANEKPMIRYSQLGTDS